MRRITIYLILAVIAIGIAWDLYVILSNSEGATISEIVLSASKRWPIIPLAVGTLLGHFFWPQKAGN